jgi:uncharacterized damage-inducible protein DinB
VTEAPAAGHPFGALARYNAAANRRLYAACATLDDKALRQDRGAFFGSIWGTLNHLMVVDRLWLTRFAGGDAPSTDLDAILFDDFDALATARVAMDARIERFAAALTPSFLAGSIRYASLQGNRVEDPVTVLLLHFFNHQTHHRGQVHALLSQAGLADPPVLDLQHLLRP